MMSAWKTINYAPPLLLGQIAPGRLLLSPPPSIPLGPVKKSLHSRLTVALCARGGGGEIIQLCTKASGWRHDEIVPHFLPPTPPPRQRV